MHHNLVASPCVLQSVHVPMSVKAIERLIRKLDTDGDGEVDYA